MLTPLLKACVDFDWLSPSLEDSLPGHSECYLNTLSFSSPQLTSAKSHGALVIASIALLLL